MKYTLWRFNQILLPWLGSYTKQKLCGKELRLCKYDKLYNNSFVFKNFLYT